MDLKAFEQEYGLIMDSKLTNSQRNYKLGRLMTQMEIEFDIPSIEDKAWNAANREVIELYRTISNSRAFC